MPFPYLPDESDANEQKVVVSERDAREAARLLQLLSTAIDGQANLTGEQLPDREKLMERARLLLAIRQLRATYFNRAMFGEPAWDVLLALYIAEGAENPQSVGRIAELVQAPLTTVARWIDYLEKERMACREAHPSDKRVIFVRLLERGRQLLESYLTNVPLKPVDES